MKRIYLEKVEQRNNGFYVGKADPRIMVQLADDIQVEWVYIGLHN